MAATDDAALRHPPVERVSARRNMAEKVATLRTADYLRGRAKRGSREKLLATLQ